MRFCAGRRMPTLPDAAASSKLPERQTCFLKKMAKKTVADLVILRELTGFKSRIFSGLMIQEMLMKTSRFTEPQILAILRRQKAAFLCGSIPGHGMSAASFYTWRSKYGGMDALMISQMKALENENRRLKKMYAEMSVQVELLMEALGKNTRPSQRHRATVSVQPRKIGGLESAFWSPTAPS